MIYTDDTAKNSMDMLLLVGDHPALDLLNSSIPPSHIDFLSNGSSMRLWIEAAKILPQRVIQAIDQFSPEEKDKLASDLRNLRENFRQLLFKRKTLENSNEGSTDSLDFNHLNSCLERTPINQVLTTENGKYHLIAQRDLSSPDGVLGEIATICADLIANQPSEQVQKCENPACTMWFNDSKRGPKRRWCSMAICGNRAKVAAHRARARKEMA
jgi:predicted RNA-binding Zn ribbon-like protein